MFSTSQLLLPSLVRERSNTVLHLILAGVIPQAGCAYFYTCGPRGNVVLLFATFIYVALTVQEYLSTGRILSALFHASLALAAQTLLIILATALYRLSPLHPLAKFPGGLLDKVTDLRLAYITYSGRRGAHVVALHERYGVIVRIGPNKLSINSADAVHSIYASSQAFDKAASYRPGRIGDGSLFFARGRAEHLHRRRIWTGALTSTAIQQWDDIMKARTEQLVECIARRQDFCNSVDLTSCLDHWAFDFAGDLIFGTECSRPELMREGDPGDVVRNAQKAILAFEIFGEVPALADILSGSPATEGYKKTENFAAKYLKERVKISSENSWDLCSFFLAQREESQHSPMCEADLNADTVLALEAGADSTAGFLTLIMFYLLRHPETYEKLKHELDEAFPTGEITADQHAYLAELPYLAAVVNEGLRLGSGYSGFLRVVPKGGAVLDGQFIPEDTIVGIPVHAQHINPDNFWPAPREFMPERWFEDGLGPGMVTRQTAFMAFQFGPFSCPGKAFAYRQINAVISHVILAYDLSFAPDFDPQAFVKGCLNTRTKIINYHLKAKAIRRQHY
ncbi:uncharacterized protein PHACADRAFT_205387 [Phanerochaete carnosa HHB-10118-sp]|uniref:Cytochrome P450 n=1 Tax=Phanerochaete carnosa (strain HHB-10118-sp) TaxID=650164 RepID=K5V8Q5_PHACS|nr:uncharacterized protein PHACADRAFT_205387 [Phanerochaete carnosa HHB-10118-sp]EKM59211.1 hypothetical protein PHACADRAFT_205387 [Phanerochaete carnosa HHB-10118-sp]